MMSSRVDLRPLKQFASENLGRQSALQEVLLAEKNEIPAAEFLAKLPTWLVLLRREEQRWNSSGVD